MKQTKGREYLRSSPSSLSPSHPQEDDFKDKWADKWAEHRPNSSCVTGLWAVSGQSRGARASLDHGGAKHEKLSGSSSID